MIGQEITKAKQLLVAGEVVAIPTETVYGLAANALNVSAVTKIFEVKNRPSFDPLIIHVADFEKINNYVIEFPEELKTLATHFMPGPLTLLLPKKEVIPDLVTAGLARVAIRIPDHPMTLELLKSLDFPLAAPSANPFGYISPTKAVHVAQQLGAQVPYILEGGDCQVGLESTIVGIENQEVMIYRLGGLSLESIEEKVGKVQVQIHSSSNPKSPGQLKSHYAPSIQTFINEGEDWKKLNIQSEKLGSLNFQENIPEIPPKNQFILSEKGDINEAAQRLFEGLRYLDTIDLDMILLHFVPNEGLGRAINDRLRRASVNSND